MEAVLDRIGIMKCLLFWEPPGECGRRGSGVCCTYVYG